MTKEIEQTQLTRDMENTYSSSRRNIMPDGTNTEGGGVATASPAERGSRREGANIGPDEARRMVTDFMATLGGRPPNIDELNAVNSILSAARADAPRSPDEGLRELSEVLREGAGTDVPLSVDDTTRHLERVRDEAERGRERRGGERTDPRASLLGPDEEVLPEAEDQEQDPNRWFHDARQEALDRQASSQGSEKGYLYLRQHDLDDLETDNPLKWLEEKFNQIYRYANQGQELDSPVIQQIQSAFGEASTVVERRLGRVNPDIVTQFNEEFLGKLNLIFMRSAVEQGDMESIAGMAKRVLARGVFNAMSFEKGSVGKFYNRLQEYYDDKRLALGGKEFKMYPEHDAKVQDELEDQEFKKAEKEVGDFGEFYKDRIESLKSQEAGLTLRQLQILRGDEVLRDENIDPDATEGLPPEKQAILKEQLDKAREQEAEELTRQEIKRALRTAYDLFQVTQRHAVINARAGSLGGSEWKAYLGQAGGAFEVFNAENMLWDEFGILNEHDKHFLNEIKLDLAKDDLKSKGKSARGWSEEKLLQHGKVLLRDLYAVKDLYSSRWRMGGMLEHLDDYADAKGFEKEDFGLFVRLTMDHDGKDRVKNWGKVAEYRPDVMIKILRERENNILSHLYGRMESHGISLTEEEKGKGLTHYDKFKKEYGDILSAIREAGMREDKPRRINFANLRDGKNEEYIEMIRKYKGEEAVDIIINIHKDMQEYIQKYKDYDGNNVIEKFVDNPKFGDLYTRVYEADDLLLENLENDAENFGLVRLSRKIAQDVRTDGLVRNFKDLLHAGAAQGELFKFIKEENSEVRIKAALEFAEHASMYGGQVSRVKGVRFTVGTFLNLAKKSFKADVFDADKGINRMAISGLQKIYGPQAEAFSRMDLRDQLDQIRLKLVDVEGENAEKYYKDLEALLGVRGRSINSVKLSALVLFLALAGVLVLPATFKEALDAGSLE